MKPIELLIHRTDTDDTHIKYREICAAREEIARLRAIEKSANKLNEIVEGVRNQRWVGDVGGRLKDTPEWCAFYCAVKDQQNIRSQPHAEDKA